MVHPRTFQVRRPNDRDSHLRIDSYLAGVGDVEWLDDSCVVPVCEWVGEIEPEHASQPVRVVEVRPRPSSALGVSPRAIIKRLPSASPCVPSREDPTVRTTTISRVTRWPVAVCGFVALTFAVAAIAKSPIGHSSTTLQRIVSNVELHGANVVTAVRTESGLLR